VAVFHTFFLFHSVWCLLSSQLSFCLDSTYALFGEWWGASACLLRVQPYQTLAKHTQWQRRIRVERRQSVFLLSILRNNLRMRNNVNNTTTFLSLRVCTPSSHGSLQQEGSFDTTASGTKGLGSSLSPFPA
jgi:hypothetical protein